MKDQLVRWILSLLERSGRPSVLLWAIRLIRRLYRSDPVSYRDLIQDQASRDHWLPRFFAAHEAHMVHERWPQETRELLIRLSGSEQEMVREGAARSWGELLARDFDAIFPVLRELSTDSRYEIRYTAALAPVRPYREDQLTPSQKTRVREFWESFENDSRRSLWNLVRQQILHRYGSSSSDSSHR